MTTFDAAIHANKIRGNDRGRFATQQRSESTESLLAGSRWDLSGHEEFLDEGRLAKLVHFNGVKPTDGPDGSPAVIIFHEDGSRTEKRYTDGVMHDGSGEHPSIARYNSEGTLRSLLRGYRGARYFVEHTPPDGQPSRDHTWSNGVRDIHYCQHGHRVDPSPGVAGSERHTAEGISVYYHHNAKGEQHASAPGEPAVFSYGPDASLRTVGYYENGKMVNGPHGMFSEHFRSDGSIEQISRVTYEDDGYRNRPVFSTEHYDSPRSASAEITAEQPLSPAEIVDRISPTGEVKLCVRIPLAKQRGTSMLAAAGINQGLTEIIAVKVATPRNRTVFTVTADAKPLLDSWAAGDEFDQYWSAKAAARTHNS